MPADRQHKTVALTCKVRWINLSEWVDAPQYHPVSGTKSVRHNEHNVRVTANSSSAVPLISLITKLWKLIITDEQYMPSDRRPSASCRQPIGGARNKTRPLRGYFNLFIYCTLTGHESATSTIYGAATVVFSCAEQTSKLRRRHFKVRYLRQFVCPLNCVDASLI